MPPEEKKLQPLPTVLLWHETPEGSHHDWMLADPTLDWPNVSEHSLSLWTARVMPPSSQWQQRGAFELVPLPLHRKTYLTYEGPISGDRGIVKRVDEGTFVPIEWTADRKVVEVEMHDFKGRIEIANSADGICVATVMPTRTPRGA